MKMHIVFVEPAQYTVDLYTNVYVDEAVTFLYSSSKAKARSAGDLLKTAYFCNKNTFFTNLKHFCNIGLKNDLVIVNGYDHWSFILLYFISLFKKLYIGVESDTPYRETHGWKNLVKSIYLGTVFRSKTVLGLSGGTGAHRDLFLNYGMDERRVFVMPMMIDNQKFYIPEATSFHKYPVFLYVGRLSPEKNIKLLIKAFKSTFALNNKGKLIIVGGGSCEEELKQLSGSCEGIFFKGPAYGGDLLNHYHQADVLILPSVFDPWGLVVNEAMASKLAVICSSAVGAADDLVRHPESGWVFDSDNQCALEELLKFCITNPQEVSKRAKNGYNFINTHWNYKVYTQNLNKIKEYVATH